MTVLSLSPDCVYERETAHVQWSSSPVYPSALHPHGQWRAVELMGLRTFFFPPLPFFPLLPPTRSRRSDRK